MSSSSNEGSTRAILYALTANGGIAIAKAAAALYTGSGAMFAESLHSLADCVNQILLLVGMKRSTLPEDDDHPMGYGREAYFYAMLVALLLFFGGGAYSFYEGVHRLMDPQPVKNVGVALAVLVLSLFLEASALRGALREIHKTSGGKPFWKWFRETRQSELMVIAGEDIAALAGLAAASTFVVLTMITGNPIFDAMGTLSVGIILMVVAFAVLREVRAMIVGESADPEMRKAINSFVRAQPEVEKVFRIITMVWGQHLMVAVKAKMRNTATAGQMVDAINQVEERIQQRWPQARWVFFEPDIK